MGYLNNFVILEGDSEGDEDSNNNMTAISDIFGPYTSIIKKVCNKCERILEYYDNFQDKNIKFCGILVDFMHFNIKHLTRSKEENLENFKQATFYQSFNRFEIALNSIEKFIYGISDYGIVRNFMILSMLRKSLDNHFNEIWTLCMDFQKNGDIIDTSRLILVKTLQEFRNRNQSPQEPSKNRNSETMKGANLDPNSTAEAAATTAITKTTTINQEWKVIIILYMNGLKRRLLKLYEKNCINWVTKLKIAYDVVRGLSYLQSVNILHHSVKCENILIDGMGDAKVANFDKEVQELWDVTWELVYQKIPYKDFKVNDINDYVLSGW
ncbi:15288_t:CDS:2 [Entrophospora sp. SA101]|nr:15288_t:CDS:2 [Entrophospora sp. SA101]